MDKRSWMDKLLSIETSAYKLGWTTLRAPVLAPPPLALPLAIFLTFVGGKIFIQARYTMAGTTAAGREAVR